MLQQLKSKVKNTIQLATGRNVFDDVLLRKLSGATVQACHTILESRPEGLSLEEVGKKQEEYGLNTIVHEKASPWYVQLLYAFLTPFNAVLSTVAIVSLLTDVIFVKPQEQQYDTLIIISSMILLKLNDSFLAGIQK